MNPRESRVVIHPKIEIARKLSVFVTHDPFSAVGIRWLTDRREEEVNKRYDSRIEEALNNVQTLSQGSNEWETARINLGIMQMQYRHARLLCTMLGSLNLEVKTRALTLIKMDPKEGFIEMEEILLELDEARKK